jgi:hypothetical protein
MKCIATPKTLANPSNERTSNGWSCKPGGLSSVWQGQPIPAAHVKRYVAMKGKEGK